MMRPFPLGLLLLCQIATSWSWAKEPSAVGREMNAIPPREQWETVRLEDLEVSDPVLRYRLRCFDATARRLAQPSWEYQPYHVKSPGYIMWTAWWATPSGLGPFGLYGSLPNPRPDEEQHIIMIEAFRDRNAPKAIDEVFLVAFRKAPVNQWGASVQYAFPNQKRSFHGDAFDLQFAFRKADDVESRKSDLRLSEHLTSFAREKTYGDTRYYFHAAIEKVANSDEEVMRCNEELAQVRGVAHWRT